MEHHKLVKNCPFFASRKYLISALALWNLSIHHTKVVKALHEERSNQPEIETELKS